MAPAVTMRSDRVFVVLLVLLFSFCQIFVGGTKEYQRKLTVSVNPNATTLPPGGDLLHVRAVGDDDTLHFLFCSQGAPTLLIVHTNSSTSSVQVNWPQFLSRNVSGGLRVEPQSSIQYSIAVVFSRLLEYDDVNDTAKPDSGFFPPYELQNFKWTRLQLFGAAALVCGKTPEFVNGSLCLKLSVFDSDGRAESWPRLLHSPNSSQLEVWLDGITTQAPNSRFLLELQAVGGDFPLSRVDVRQFIDDEFTPSIFKVSEWVSPAAGGSDVLGYVQWKPVAYRQSSPALEDATPCRYSDPQSQDANATAASSALIRAFFSAHNVTGLNVSFGLAGEPFYNSTKFLSWTVLVGVGAPPVDTFSPIVLTIMAVGLGIPVILLLLGGVFVCIHKRRQGATAAYQSIN